MRYRNERFFREENHVLNWFITLVILGATWWALGCERQARAGDAVPFFRLDHPKPVVYGPPEGHPIAIECAVDDEACVEEHDERALDLAIGLMPGGSVASCDGATEPARCREEAAVILGDFAPDPVLQDACAWVVRVDSGVATVYSRKLMVTHRVTNQGWRAAQFIGRCDVSTVGPAVTEASHATDLPFFPWTAQ